MVNLKYGHISVADSLPRADEAYKPVTDEVVTTLAAAGRELEWPALTRIHTVVMPTEIETPKQQGGSDCAVLALRTAGAAAAHGPDPLIWQQKSSQKKQSRVYRPGWGRDYWRKMNSVQNREAIAQELISTRLVRCDVDSDREQESAAAWLAQEAITPQKPLSLTEAAEKYSQFKLHRAELMINPYDAEDMDNLLKQFENGSAGHHIRVKRTAAGITVEESGPEDSQPPRHAESNTTPAKGGPQQSSAYQQFVKKLRNQVTLAQEETTTMGGLETRAQQRCPLQMETRTIRLMASIARFRNGEPGVRKTPTDSALPQCKADVLHCGGWSPPRI
eukprot:COSAG05_NODE_189_length_14633_cov_44.869134_5_plen_333_part_00